MAGRRIRIEAGGATAIAELHDDTSPKTTEAFWKSLPLDAPLEQTMWCGAAATFAHPALAALTDDEDAVCSIYPGELVVRPRGEEVLISFGAAEVRTELGVAYANRLGTIVEGRDALFPVLKAMYEKGDSRITISAVSGAAGSASARASPAGAPAPAAEPHSKVRLIEVEVAGAKATYALDDEGAPRTAALLWDMLPIETTTFYSRWAGDAAVVETRPERVATLLEGELEAPVTSMYSGRILCGPTPRWMDIFLSFGGSESRGPNGRRYVTVVGEVQGDASALFAMLKRTRREGEKPVVIRRKSA